MKWSGQNVLVSLLTCFLALWLLCTVTAVEEKTDTQGFTTLTHSTLTLNWRHKQSSSSTPQLQVTSHSVQSARNKGLKCFYSLTTSLSSLHLNWSEVRVQKLAASDWSWYTYHRLLQIKERAQNRWLLVTRVWFFSKLIFLTSHGNCQKIRSIFCTLDLQGYCDWTFKSTLPDSQIYLIWFYKKVEFEVLLYFLL